jgi:hypothetical protein
MDTILSALPNEKHPVSLDNFIIICIGYAEISSEEKVKEIVRYETERDWSYGMSTETKLAYFEIFCDESKTVKTTAERLGLKYFDVSYDREIVLDEIMRYIKQNLS